MALSLTKNQTLSLKKDDNSGLTKIFLGCGWDAAKPKTSGGFFSKMFQSVTAPSSIDLDASCVMLDASRNIVDQVWFRQLRSKCGSVRHSGDNLTGDGDGDDEVIAVDLTTIPAVVKYLVFTVNSYRGQTFDDVDNAFIRLVDADTKKEVASYSLTKSGSHTGMVMAVVARDASGAWALTALGNPSSGSTFHAMLPDIKSSLDEVSI